MKKIRWQIIVVVLAITAIIILLLPQGEEAFPPGVEQQVEKPSVGGIYTEAIVGSPGRLNPMYDWVNPADRVVNRLLYSSLIKFDSSGLPFGDLADSWGISQDGRVYNFSLREAFWHDGEAITSNDVVFTIGLLQQESLPVPDDIREFWKLVEVEALDESVVQFRLPESFSPFMSLLTFGLMPEHIWGEVSPDEILASDLNLLPVGSGPYQFVRFTIENEEITGVDLTSFKQFYRPSAFIDRFSFRYFPDFPSAYMAYQAGVSGGEITDPDKIMGIGEISASDLRATLEADNLGIYTGLVPKLGLVMINLESPTAVALQDLEVRRALSLGINRQMIVDNNLGGQAITADGPIFPASWAYYDGLAPQPYDPDQALAILIEAGYDLGIEGGNIRSKEGNQLVFRLVFPDIEPYPQIAEKLADDWGKLGVSVNLVPAPANQLEKNFLSAKNYDLALVEVNSMGEPDPDPYPFWHQTQAARGKNYSGWNDRQASEYVEVGRTQVDWQQRANLYKSFQVRFMNELPSLPLFFLVESVGIDREVQGVRIGPMYDPLDRYNNVNEWFILTSPQVATNP